MKKKNQIKTAVILLVIILFGFLYYVNSILGKRELESLKSFFNSEQKYLIKKYIFPYKFIRILEEKNAQDSFFNLELKFKKNLKDTEVFKNSIKLSNGKILDRFKLNGGFYAGINNFYPGSGYVNIYDDRLLILSSRGVLVYTNNIYEDIFLKQIKNNINDFITLKQFQKDKWFSLKDKIIHNDKIFISYTEEIKKDCWNTSVIYGDFNYSNIKFEKLFSHKDCVSSLKNIDNEFNGSQSGGRLISFDQNHILLTTGEYRSRHLAQNEKSINGKVLKINTDNSNHQIISMGHRNPQGLLFDKENNFLLETEHGPKGGDEVNLIEIERINNEKILNYGWPIVSAGEHYGGRNEANKKKYEKYPLYKSHSEYGFIEPLKSFVPSIGISEIVKIGKNKYVLSSMKDRSLYFFELDFNKQLINLERIEVNERIRDLHFNNNKLYLFLEDSASIGIINLNY